VSLYKTKIYNLKRKSITKKQFFDLYLETKWKH